MNMDQASGPRMPRIKKLVLRDPVGVPSSCCTTTSERIDHWTKMRRSLARFSRQEASNRIPSLVDFIAITPGFRLSVHTAVPSSRPAERRSRRAQGRSRPARPAVALGLRLAKTGLTMEIADGIAAMTAFLDVSAPLRRADPCDECLLSG